MRQEEAREEIAAADSAAAGAPPTAVHTGAVPASTIKPRKRYAYRFFKRAFDIVSSGAVLLIFSWFILILLFIKWLEDVGTPAYSLEITEVGSMDAPKAKKAKRLVNKDGKILDCILKPRKLEKGERVCIVDDIYTTGSTVEACAKELLAAGASEVFFICVCIGCGRK